MNTIITPQTASEIQDMSDDGREVDTGIYVLKNYVGNNGLWENEDYDHTYQLVIHPDECHSSYDIEKMDNNLLESISPYFAKLQSEISLIAGRELVFSLDGCNPDSDSWVA